MSCDVSEQKRVQSKMRTNGGVQAWYELDNCADRH